MSIAGLAQPTFTFETTRNKALIWQVVVITKVPQFRIVTRCDQTGVPTEAFESTRNVQLEGSKYMHTLKFRVTEGNNYTLYDSNGAVINTNCILDSVMSYK